MIRIEIDDRQAQSALAELARRGWWGRATLVDPASGEPLPCTPESIARLMEIAYVRLAFAAAYLELVQGREAARKN
jgi:hypothetical protein